LAIEVDGDSHFQPGARQADERRQEFIEGLGIHVVRVTNTAVYEDLDGVVDARGGGRGNLP
jgi:very-short-patch-repair endonuclease